MAVSAALFVVDHDQLWGGAAGPKSRSTTGTGTRFLAGGVAVVVAFLLFGWAHEGARLS